MFYPVRPGNRGGRDLFKWDDIRYMKYNDREQYLGVTVRAGYLDKGGKWRKGDWYTKEKGNGLNQTLNSEKMSVQQQDERRIRQALGLEEREIIDEGPKLTKYEIEEIVRKEEMEVDEDNPTGALGLGFKLNEKAIMSQKLGNEQKVNYNRLEGEGVIGNANNNENDKAFTDGKKQQNQSSVVQQLSKEQGQGQIANSKKHKKNKERKKKDQGDDAISKEERAKYLQQLENSIKQLKERKELKEQERNKQKSEEDQKKKSKISEHKSHHRRKSRSRSQEKSKHKHHHNRK